MPPTCVRLQKRLNLVLECPTEDPVNMAVRDEFRMNTFPPRAGTAEEEPPQRPPTPPPA